MYAGIRMQKRRCEWVVGCQNRLGVSVEHEKGSPYVRWRDQSRSQGMIVELEEKAEPSFLAPYRLFTAESTWIQLWRSEEVDEGSRLCWIPESGLAVSRKEISLEYPLPH